MIMLHTLKAGDKVLVKVGKNAIMAEVLENNMDSVKVRNMTNGHEFKTSRIVELLDQPQPACQPADDTQTIENETECMEPEADAREQVADAIVEAIAPAVITQVQAQPELAQTVADAAAAPEVKPAKKMSLLEAAYNVLLQEQKPMNTRELVKAAIDKGLWIPTSCKTPEQSLYGAIFLEMKKAQAPRFKKSEKRGAFELA